MNEKIIINGQNQLNGEVIIAGSKNAVLPILSACILSKEISTLTNVPDISDIHTLLHIMDYLEIKSNFNNGTLTIDPTNIQNKPIPHDLVSKMRGSIMLLAPLLVRYGEVKLSFPGGCVLGKRPIDTHLQVFEALGAEVVDATENIQIKTNGLKGKTFTMKEMSVTATENAIMAACLAEGKSIIKLCAAEPHVQDLCNALNEAGAKISGIGTHTLTIEGVKKIGAINHKICSDYLEIGTYAIAAVVTGGNVIIKNAQENHLDSFWQKMKEAGVKFKHRENEVEIFSNNKLKAVDVRTSVHPSFPTDLQAQFAVLLTQAEGNGSVFETLFEGKMNYIFELEKMGANVNLLNNHQGVIKGKTELIGCPVASLDIRAGAAMVIAALCAKGKTEISNINYIFRGYSNLIEKLTKLGADIKVKK